MMFYFKKFDPFYLKSSLADILFFIFEMNDYSDSFF